MVSDLGMAKWTKFRQIIVNLFWHPFGYRCQYPGNLMCYHREGFGTVCPRSLANLLKLLAIYIKKGQGFLDIQ